jgi:hypothetical protein
MGGAPLVGVPPNAMVQSDQRGAVKQSESGGRFARSVQRRLKDG